MPTLSTIALSVLNISILVFAVDYIAFAHDINLASSVNPCLRRSVSSIRWIGVASLVVAAVGLIGTCSKHRALQSTYLWALLISTFATVAFCAFVAATKPRMTATETFESTAEHGVWMRAFRPAYVKAVANDKDWLAVKACFREIDTCVTMVNQTEEQKDKFIDVGCCSPPNRCGMHQVSTGRWVAPPNGLNSTDDECKMWVKVGLNFYECESCKAGYLASFLDMWDRDTTSHIVCVIVLIIISALAFYTSINDHRCGDNKDPIQRKLVSHV